MNVRLTLAVVVALAAAQVAVAQERAGRKVELKSLRDKASYSFGMAMGGTLKKQGVDIDIDLLMQGIKDSATGGKMLLTEEQAFEAMQTFEKDVIAKQAEDSKRFLADNKKRPGVKTTASGLQYKVLKAGKGAKPKADDVVSVTYRASFINGSEFETNGEKPFSTPVNQVIPGWVEALQLMEVGSKWQLFIPPDLAYGEQGSPPTIGPNTTLIFELELVQINKPTTGATKKTGPLK
jgi:FKBP-type peptidyl-prolyl cis-trans isomerase